MTYFWLSTVKNKLPVYIEAACARYQVYFRSNLKQKYKN